MDSVDESYIWQRRIAHGIRYQKGAVPFPESVDIGLEFNAALKRKEKLDQCLLTNSVMLEICQFAKTVTRSEKYFLFEMLEFNFDLSFDINNDSLCYIYAVRVHNRIKHLKEQIKMKPKRWKETFQLPDPSVLAGSKEEEVSGRYCPKWNKTADSSVLTVSSKNCQSSDNHEAETTRVASNKYTVKRQGGIRKTQDTNLFCAQLGVTLAVRPSQTPKQKLDPSLLTNGVMIEMLDFSRVLCGKHTYIVYELVKHNFGYAFNKPQFRMCLNRVIERKHTCLTAEDKDAFRKELFKVPAEKNKWEYKGKKRKTPDADDQELEAQILSSNKRQTRRQQANKMEELKEDDLSYMCPVEFETELQSGTEAEPENVKPESCLSGTEVEMNMLQDVKPEEEEVFISPVQPLNNGHKSSLSPTQTKDESQEPYWCLFSEGKCAETQKQRLWLRRAARAKQILMSSRVNDMFAHCREIGLDFNFCSGTKRSLDLQLLTNWVMWEVSKFGTALSRSVRSFLFEILLNNFTLTLQDEQHERNFLVYMMAKHKNLLNHPKSQNMDFLCKPFNLPEIYHMVDVTSSFQQEVQSQGQEGLDSSDSAKSEEAEKEKHPFCKKLGLNLWSTKERPSNQKLDLTVLTTGAVLEIFSFVKELCGEARNTVNDILEHNFDLDLQSGEAEAAQMIQRWYTTQKNLMKKQNISPKINRWLNMIIPLNGNLQQIPDLPTEGGELDLNKEELDGFCGFVKCFDYQNCKEIGLDLDLGSKSETKTKLDLQVLTRGALFEVHQYVQQNYNRYVPALYEILEYNFDLSSQSHRKVEFAWSIASQVIAMTGKKCRKGDYLNKVFELPFEASKFPEFSQVVFKEEREDNFGELDHNDIDNDDIVFVRKLKPVDMEVEID